MEYNCEPPFWEDPMILYKQFSLQYIPSCKHTMYNFMTRIIILSIIVGCIGSIFAGLPFFMIALLFGVITACAIIFTTPSNDNKIDKKIDTPVVVTEEAQQNSRQECHEKCEKSYNTEYHPLPFTAIVDPSGTEHFVNGGSHINSVQPNGPVDPYGIVEVDAMRYSGPSLPDYTPPTSKNLFMNVLLDEYKYNPDRPDAAPIGQPTVKQAMDDFFRVQWFSDPTDVFGKNQGQRQFITQPSTTVPNDQGSFANWLYKIPGKTCKEGGRSACLAGTDGGLMPWLSNSS